MATKANQRHKKTSSTQRTRAYNEAHTKLWKAYIAGLEALGVTSDPRLFLASGTLDGPDSAAQAAAELIRREFNRRVAELNAGRVADDTPSERVATAQLRHWFGSYRKPDQPLLANKRQLVWRPRALELTRHLLDRAVGHVWPLEWPALQWADSEAALLAHGLDLNHADPVASLDALPYGAKLLWVAGLFDWLIREQPQNRTAALSAIETHVIDGRPIEAVLRSLVGQLDTPAQADPEVLHDWEAHPDAQGCDVAAHAAADHPPGVVPAPSAAHAAADHPPGVVPAPTAAASARPIFVTRRPKTSSPPPSTCPSEAGDQPTTSDIVAVECGQPAPAVQATGLTIEDIPPVPSSLNDDALVVRCQEHCLRRATNCAMHLMVETSSTVLVLVGPTGADLTTLGNYLRPMGNRCPTIIVEDSSWHTTVPPPMTLRQHRWLKEANTATGKRVALVCCGMSSLTGLGSLTEAQAVVSCEPTILASDPVWPRTAKPSQSYTVRADSNGRLTLTPRGFCGPERVLLNDASPYLNTAVTLADGPRALHYAVEMVTAYYVAPEHKAPDSTRAPVAVVLAMRRVEHPAPGHRICVPDTDTENLDPAHHHALSGFVGNGDGKRYVQNTMQAMLKQHGTITTASWNAHMARAGQILQTVAPSVPVVNQWAGFSQALCDPHAGSVELLSRSTLGVFRGVAHGALRGLGVRAATHTGWAFVACLLAILYYSIPLALASAAYWAPYVGLALTTAPRVFVALFAAVGVGTAAAMGQHHSRWWVLIMLLSLLGGATACAVVPGHGMLANEYHALVRQTQNCTDLFPSSLYNATPTSVAVSRCFPLGSDSRDAGLFAAMCVACGACVRVTPADCYTPGPHRIGPTVTGGSAPHCNKTDGDCWFCPVDVPVSENRGVVALARAGAVGRHLCAEIGYRANRTILRYQVLAGNYTALIVKTTSALWHRSLFAFSQVVFYNGTSFGHNYTLTGADVIEVASYVIRRAEDGYRAVSPAERQRPAVLMWTVAAVAICALATQQSSSSVRKGEIDERQATWKHMTQRPGGLYRIAGAEPNTGLIHTTPICLGAPDPVVGPEHRLQTPNGVQAHCPPGGSHPVLTGLATAATYAVARCPHNAMNAVVNRHCVARPPPHTRLSHADRTACPDCLPTVDLGVLLGAAGVKVDHWRSGGYLRGGTCRDEAVPDLAGRCLACSAHAVPYVRATRQWAADAHTLRRLLAQELCGADAAWAARLTAAGLARLEDAALVEHTVAWLVKAFTKTEVNLYPPTKARLIQGYGQPSAQLVHAVLTFAIQHVAAEYHNGPDATGYEVPESDCADRDWCCFGCGLRPGDLAALPARLSDAADGIVDCPRNCDCYCHCSDVEDAHVRCRCRDTSADWVEMDCSNYDAHNSAMHFWASWTFYFWCVHDCLNPGDARLYLQYVIDCFAVVTTYRNDETTFRVHIYGTTKSGHNDTSLGNTLRGIAMWLEAASQVRRRLGASDGGTAVRLAVAQAGDDSIAYVRCRVPSRIDSCFSAHGMKTKTATWDRHYDASFLSATWAHTPAGDVFVSKPGRLLAKLFWAHPFRGTSEAYARRHAASVALGVLPTGRLIPGVRQFLQRVWSLGQADLDVSTYLRWNPMVAAWDPSAYSDDVAWPWMQERYGVTQDELDEFVRLVVSARTGDLIACEFASKIMMRDLPDAPELDDALDDVLAAGEVEVRAVNNF